MGREKKGGGKKGKGLAQVATGRGEAPRGGSRGARTAHPARLSGSAVPAGRGPRGSAARLPLLCPGLERAGPPAAGRLLTRGAERLGRRHREVSFYDGGRRAGRGEAGPEVEPAQGSGDSASWKTSEAVTHPRCW